MEKRISSTVFQKQSGWIYSIDAPNYNEYRIGA